MFFRIGNKWTGPACFDEILGPYIREVKKYSISQEQLLNAWVPVKSALDLQVGYYLEQGPTSDIITRKEYAHVAYKPISAEQIAELIKKKRFFISTNDNGQPKFLEGSPICIL